MYKKKIIINIIIGNSKDKDKKKIRKNKRKNKKSLYHFSFLYK